MIAETLVINPDPGCCRTTDPDMAFGSGSGPDVIMAHGSSTSHSDQLDLSDSKALRHLQGQVVAQMPSILVICVGNMG